MSTKNQNHEDDYKIKIDKSQYETEQRVITGSELLALAGLSAAEYDLRLKNKGGQTLIRADDEVDLSKPGIEKFVTFKKETSEGCD